MPGTRTRLAGIALAGILALLLAGCGGGRDGAGATALTSYRYTLSVNLAGSASGGLKLGVTSEGEYVAPDRYHGTCRAVAGPLTVAREEAVKIGGQTWVKDQTTRGAFVAKEPVACHADVAKVMAGVITADRLGVPGERTTVNGVQTVKYHLTKEDANRLIVTALASAVPSASIVSLDDLIAGVAFTADLWLTAAGDQLVKVLAQAEAGSADQQTAVTIRFDVRDVNARDIRVEPP